MFDSKSMRLQFRLIWIPAGYSTEALPTRITQARQCLCGKPDVWVVYTQHARSAQFTGVIVRAPGTCGIHWASYIRFVRNAGRIC
jgi:hypothetical protein